MLRLLPVMSSMFVVFQAPVVSGVQAMLHVEPSLYTAPGDGVRGVTSARTREEPSKADKASKVNITKVYG
jgi:hypothetical protein